MIWKKISLSVNYRQNETGRDLGQGETVKERNRDTKTERNVTFERVPVFVETKAFVNFHFKKNYSNR